MKNEKRLYDFLADKNISSKTPFVCNDSDIEKAIGVSHKTLTIYKRLLKDNGVIKTELITIGGKRKVAYTYCKKTVPAVAIYKNEGI